MRLKHAQTNHEKRSRNKVFLLLGVMMLALAACNAEQISTNMRYNIAVDASQTKTAWSESYYYSALESVPKTIRNSTVRIRYLDNETDEFHGGGTGLITEIVKSPNGESYAIVITARHVLNDNQNVKLSTQLDENSFSSNNNTFIRIGPDLAVAAFKLENSNEKPPQAFGINNLRVTDVSSIALNSNLIALGYPNEPDGKGGLQSQNHQFPSNLSVLYFDVFEGSEIIVTYGTAAGGMSGCPVVDIKGNIIGFLLGFDPNLGDLIFQDPKNMRIQPVTQELLDQYKTFVEGISGTSTQ